MKHEITESGNTLVVTFDGDMDLANSRAARKILLDAVAKSGGVVVDLSRVGYVDSSGIASLIEALQTSRKKGGTFVLVALSEGASRVLELARLDKIFTIYPSLEEGLAAVVE